MLLMIPEILMFPAVVTTQPSAPARRESWHVATQRCCQAVGYTVRWIHAIGNFLGGVLALVTIGRWLLGG
jgi:hypothetical protein